MTTPKHRKQASEASEASVKLKEAQSVQDQVKNMTEMFNELESIADKISDEDRVVSLLASLLESFDVLVTGLEANSTVPEMETVVKRLLHEERKLNEKDPSPSTESERASYDTEAQNKGTTMSTSATNLVTYGETVASNRSKRPSFKSITIDPPGQSRQ